MAGSPPKLPPAALPMAGSPPKPPPTAIAIDSHPFERELIESYLRPWVESDTKKGNFIHEADLYSADPDQLITNKYELATTAAGEKAWYFFTTLRRRRKGTGSNAHRQVATGRKGRSTPKKAIEAVFSDLGDTKQQIGSRQDLDFEMKEDRKRVGWHMVEFRLHPEHGSGHNQGSQQAASSDVPVLCKLYRTRTMKVNANDETFAAAMMALGHTEADKKIGAGAEAEAGPGRRKADDMDMDSGAETSAAWTEVAEPESEKTEMYNW